MASPSAQQHPDWEWVLIPDFLNAAEMQEILADPSSWYLFARNKAPSFLEQNFFRVMWPKRWAWGVVASSDLFLSTPLSEQHVVLWRSYSGQGPLALAPQWGRSDGQKDPFAAGTHLFLVWDIIDIQHDIQDPGWQWRTRKLPERRWRRCGTLHAGNHCLRAGVRPRAESPEQWEPEDLHCAGGAASPLCARHCPAVRLGRKCSWMELLAACMDSGSRCIGVKFRQPSKISTGPRAKRSQ